MKEPTTFFIQIKKTTCMYTFEKLFHQHILIIRSYSSESFALFQKSLKVACKIPLYVTSKLLSNIWQAIDMCHIYFSK